MSELIDRELGYQAWIHATAMPTTPLDSKVLPKAEKVHFVKMICIGAYKMSELVDRELDWQAWIHSTALPVTPLHTRIFNNRLVLLLQSAVQPI